MKQRRLGLLVIVMLALAALRWFTIESEQDAAIVAQAMERSPMTLRSVTPVAIASPAPLIPDLALRTRDIEDQPPLNAFAVRMPPPPLAALVAPAAPAFQPFVGPPPVPPPAPAEPPPLPPFQVIGGWSDERGASVFIAGPRSIHQVRVGEVLLAEYRVDQIEAQQVRLSHVASKQAVVLPIAAGPLPFLTSAKAP